LADIFISYSKQEPEPTRKLEARGYSVWWDTSLLAGPDYTDVILRELAAATTHGRSTISAMR
jgi:hypothetical protein